MPAYGSAYLSARAIIQNGRDIPGNPHSVLFDAVILSSLEDYPRVLCSLRYITPYTARFIHGGTYDIFAKVRNIPQETRECPDAFSLLGRSLPLGCTSPPGQRPSRALYFHGRYLTSAFLCISLCLSQHVLAVAPTPD